MTPLLMLLSLSWGNHLRTRHAWRVLLVERCFIYRVKGGGSRLHGAAVYLWQALDDG
jgi:hypothetical protein